MARYSSDVKQDRAYNQPSDSKSTYNINPEWSRQTGATLAAVTAQGDTAGLYYYFDMAGYREFSIQIEDTAGATGTNTYTLEISLQDDGTEAASCTYQDATVTFTGAASVTADTVWIVDTPQTFKYGRVKVVRTGDGAATDGAWTIYLKQSW